MGLLTVNPTANQTPDVTLGGLAVTGVSNTGHASTTTAAVDGNNQTKSARWFTFTVPGGQKTSVTLKFDSTSSGTLVGGFPDNTYQVDYSLNNGSSWTNALTRNGFTASVGPTTVSVPLSAGQDISQVQVRTLQRVTTGGPGDSASTTVTIANIKLEVVTLDATAVLIM